MYDVSKIGGEGFSRIEGDKPRTGFGMLHPQRNRPGAENGGKGGLNLNLVRRGSDVRAGRSPHLVGRAERKHAAMDALLVTSSRASMKANRCGAKLSDEEASREGGEIEELFGQLWWVPSSPPPRVSHQPLNQCWIRRELWGSRSFTAKDCYLVKSGDTLRSDPKQGSFAVDFWGKGEKRSYCSVVAEGMAGRANRGRGRGRGADVVESGLST
jgi:hypothetical protein